MVDVNALLSNTASFISGLFLLEYAADKFIDHTAVVAKRLNVSPTLVGLLTCGAEWEELVVIIIALTQKKSTMALGNLMGSSVANILGSFSLGLFFLRSATFDQSSKIYASVLMVLTTLFALFLIALNATMKRVAGALLIAAFVVYIASVASLIYQGTLRAPEDDSSDSDSGSDSDSNSDSVSDSSRRSDGEQTDEEQGRRTRSSSSFVTNGHLLGSLKSRDAREPKVVKSIKVAPAGRRKQRKPLSFHLTRLLMGFAALVVSSYVIANSADKIGYELGLSGTVVGTTILSIATTLPEKFVAVLGGVRKQPGILVANTVGSNIFLLTLCAGVLFFWGDPDAIDLGFTMFEISAMWVSAAILLGIVLGGGQRWMGSVLLCGYVAFIMVEIMSGRSLDDD
ncbi:hypothetical protein GQ53DRAFT_686920 [Thozetella sp. PMI_491]|nr:hypothetical protein GQ53DRAFT_686920 [Thozetella sp. PMI_491]